MMHAETLPDCGISAEGSLPPRPAHRCVLSHRSEQLQAHLRFLRQSGAPDSPPPTIPLLPVSGRALGPFLLFLYT
jgi:hypothetical protein